MKTIIILGDGMADYPIARLGDKTPLQVAHKPHMDSIAARGRCGRCKIPMRPCWRRSDAASSPFMGCATATCKACRSQPRPLIRSRRAAVRPASRVN